MNYSNQHHCLDASERTTGKTHKRLTTLLKLLASTFLAVTLCAHAQIIGGTVQAGKVTNTTCTSGQTPTYDSNKRLTGCATAGAGGVADPGSNGVMTRTASNVTAPASATEISAPAYCADAGSNDTYACSLSPAPSAYATGARYIFKANTANTGAATVNFNSLGAKTIKKVAGGVTTDLADNDIRSGQIVEVAYDGTNMQLQSTLGNAATAGATPGFEKLETQVASSSASLVFTGCLSSTYDEYLFSFTNLIPGTANTSIQVNFSTDGGSLYYGGTAYNRAEHRYSSGGIGADSLSSQSTIALGSADGIGNTAALGITGKFWLSGVNDTGSVKTFEGAYFIRYNGGTFGKNTVSGYSSTTTAINAVRFQPSSGTFTSGTIRCYGVAK